ncbi:MAG: PAS domain-containing protein, partial [Chloroflexi bacterium]
MGILQSHGRRNGLLPASPGPLEAQRARRARRCSATRRGMAGRPSRRPAAAAVDRQVFVLSGLGGAFGDLERAHVSGARIKNPMAILSQLFDIPSTDLEDARKRKLLTIMLLGLLLVDVLILLLTLVFAAVSGYDEDLTLLLVGSIVFLVGFSGLLMLSRYRSGPLASILFLLLLTFVFAFSDVPEEVVDGRSLFLFAIPIIMASVLLHPASSFLFAALAGVINAVIAIFTLDVFPNMPAIMGFFAVALVSWLSARSLERALVDLRAINRELDQRVMDRTRDLAEALDRVQAESGKNQAILESIADGVIVFDMNGRAIVANYAISHLLNRSTDEIRDQSVESLLTLGNEKNDERDKVIRYVRDRRLRSGSRVKFEWEEKTLSVSVAPVRDRSGEASGTVVVFRDYTRE